VLDYKASPALSKEDKKRDEMCKDVSAFANSAGGQIVYGIEEKNQKPIRVDAGSNPAVITREWIEQVLNSRITPRIDDLIITPISLQEGVAYVISIPQATARAPHQAPDNKYYRRYNFQSIPMADYEVRDMMRRSTTPDLYVSLSFATGLTTQIQFDARTEVSRPVMLSVRIENRSAQPAHSRSPLGSDCIPSTQFVPPR
jgi:predicted HTH transcriptional regulator